MTNIERRDLGLPYISDKEVFEEQKKSKSTDTKVKYCGSFRF